LARKKGVDGSTTVSTEMGCDAKKDGPKAASKSDQDGETEEACRTVVVVAFVVGDVLVLQEEEHERANIIELGGEAKARRL
jgi:hypothetical protein